MKGRYGSSVSKCQFLIYINSYGAIAAEIQLYKERRDSATCCVLTERANTLINKAKYSTSRGLQACTSCCFLVLKKLIMGQPFFTLIFISSSQ